jgi:hypothetical protein
MLKRPFFLCSSHGDPYNVFGTDDRLKGKKLAEEKILGALTDEDIRELDKEFLKMFGKKKKREVRGKKMEKSQIDKLSETALSFSCSKSFLEKYGCNTGHQQRLKSSIGGGFLRSKTNSVKKKTKKIQSAITDEDAKDFLM